MHVEGRRRLSYAEAGLRFAAQRRRSTLHKIRSKQLQQVKSVKTQTVLEEEEHEVEKESGSKPTVTESKTDATIEKKSFTGRAVRPIVGITPGYEHAGFKTEFHRIMFRLVESKSFSAFILIIILLNTCILIGQTFPEVVARGSWYFAALDSIFLGVYIMEAVLKIYVWRTTYFKEGWNIMDFTIVMFSVLDFSLPLVLSVGGFNGAAIFRLLRIFKAIRAIRALRVLRTIRFLSNLQVIVTTCLKSIQSMGAILMLMFLFMYMFSVIGRELYAPVDKERFGTLIKALFTTFQLLTLDDWFEIYHHASVQGSGHIFFFLFSYIIVEYFVFLNLFVAVLVDNFQLTLEAQNDANRKKKANLDDSVEDDDFAAVSESDISTVSDLSDEEKPPRKVIDDYYHDKKSSEQNALSRYFQLMASLEYNTQMLHNQQRTLDLMVDMCAITEEDD